jgi:hypothetical protein
VLGNVCGGVARRASVQFYRCRAFEKEGGPEEHMSPKRYA